jgi:hypothetical protein
LSAKHAYHKRNLQARSKAVIGTYSGRNINLTQGDYLFYCGKHFGVHLMGEKKQFYLFVEPIQRFFVSWNIGL